MSLFDRAAAGEFTWITSDAVLAELSRVLRGKFAWPEAEIAEAIESVYKLATRAYPRLAVSACRDPDDNRILEAAVAGQADFIVSGDADLLSMGTFRGIRIVSVADFLAQLDSTKTT